MGNGVHHFSGQRIKKYGKCKQQRNDGEYNLYYRTRSQRRRRKQENIDNKNIIKLTEQN